MSVESMDIDKKEFWKDKNVLVTGCTGFLGSYLVKELLDLGANITGLVRDMERIPALHQKHLNQRVQFVYGTLGDWNAIRRILYENEIDTVFHLAAQSILGAAYQNPLVTFESNIQGTWNVLEACRNQQVKRVVVASSDKAYGHPPHLPLDETMPVQGRYPYDVSKSCADLIAHAYYYTYGLPVGIARYGNLFGGGDFNFTRIIPYTIQSVLKNEAPEIRSDGTLVRDYLYVEDAVRACLLLAAKLEEGQIAGEAFNFSSGIYLSVLDVVRKILQAMGSHLQPLILNQPTNESKCQYLSAAKARNRLGWKPVYGFDAGLKKTIDWYRDFFCCGGRDGACDFSDI